LRALVARTIERQRRASASHPPADATLEPKVLVGKSPAMVALYKQIAHRAAVPARGRSEENDFLPARGPGTTYLHGSAGGQP